MIVFAKFRFLRALPLFAAWSLVACGGGIGVGGPAPQPSVSATVAAPTPSNIPTPDASPSPAPSPSASTPSASPSAVPSATASASTAVTCTNPNMGTQNETWTLNGSALTIPLPPYGTFAGTIAFPAQSPASTVVSETTNQTNFNYAPTSSSGDPRFGSRADDFFMSFRLSQPTTFTGGATTLLPITIVSTCLTSGTTYYLDQFTNTDFAYVNSAVASAGEVTLDLLVAPNPYPAGDYINAILNH